MKLQYIIAAVALIITTGCAKTEKAEEIAPDYVVGAYIWDHYQDSLPIDANDFTHLFVAFGQVNDSRDGIDIERPEFLRRCAALKDSFPNLKVLLSLGGADAPGFSPMAADSLKRAAFATDCRRVIDEYGIDGVDIDWEVPGNWHGLICLDLYNNVKMLRDIRAAIGTDKLLTVASPSNLSGLLIPEALPYLDFINIMSYDMGAAPKLHTALYRSENAGCATVEETVDFYLERGVPKDKMVLGLAFYGRSDNISYPGWTEFGDMTVRDDDTVKWDDVAKVPYIVNSEGRIVLGYENPESIALKCEYAKERGLRGVMFWRYGCDDAVGTLRNTVTAHMGTGK